MNEFANSLILTGEMFRTFSAIFSDCVWPFARPRGVGDHVAVEGRRSRGDLEGRAHGGARRDRLSERLGRLGAAGDHAVHPVGTARLSLRPVTGAPVVLTNVTVVSCEEPGANVWSPGGVATADAGAMLSRVHVVLGRHDIGLHLLVKLLRRHGVGGRHRAFIEGALRAVAVVAAVAQEDGSLLAHRVIGVVGILDARSVELDLQIALLRVAAHGSPVVRFAVHRGGHESPGDDRQVRRSTCRSETR